MSIANLLKYIEAITLLLPLIDKIVTMVEGLFSKLGSGQGTAKKKAATDLVEVSLLNAGLDLPEEVLSGVVDSIVKIKNATGEFTHGLSQAPPDAESFKAPEF
jgi:hypothetical protein